MLKHCVFVCLCLTLVYGQYGYQSNGGNRYNSNYQNYQANDYQAGYSQEGERSFSRNLFNFIPQTIRNVVQNRYSNYQNRNYQRPNYVQTPYNYPNPNIQPNYQDYHNSYQEPNNQNYYPNTNNQHNYQEPTNPNNYPNPNNDNIYPNPNNQYYNPDTINQNMYPNPNNQNNNPEIINQNIYPNPNNQNNYPEPNNQNTDKNNQNNDSDGESIPNFDVRLNENIKPSTQNPQNIFDLSKDEDEPYIFPDDEPDKGELKTDDVVHVVDTADDQVTPSTQPTDLPTQGGLIQLDTTPSFETRNMFFNEAQDSCQTVDNLPGNCVALVKCSQYLTLLQQGQTPAVVNILRKAHCGFEGSNPKVCCPHQGFTPGPTAPTPPPEPLTPPPVKPDPSPKTNDDLYVDNLPEPPVCGLSTGMFSRVVKGVPAKLGLFPWMALLGYRGRRDPSTPRWLCGGSLISSKHVLTAAHCIHGREEDLYQVRLGELDLASETEGATPIDVPIKTKIKHAEYSATAFTNDIGILILDRTIQFTSLIKPICMPRAASLRSMTFEKYTPFIAGWGDTEFRGPSATHLQMTQLPVVSNAKCAKAYSAYKNQVIDHKVLCAGYDNGGRDACQGDSGGPLMQLIYNGTDYHFYQIGVVSYGKKCAEPGFPGVYSRATYFVDWIQETVTGIPAK